MKKVNLAFFGLFLVAVTSCKKAETTAQEKPKTLIVQTFAGSGSSGYLDATGTYSQFYQPKGITMDPSGNLYVTDYRNNRIRKITPEGVVTTFAGSTGGFADGTGTSAQFYFPLGIVSDANGNLYVSDTGNSKIRKITPAGLVTTYAGSGDYGYLDGDALTAQFSDIVYLTIDPANNLYVADRGNNRIRKISAAGQVTTVAGTGGYGVVDGPIATAVIGEPYGITIDPSGNLYVSQAGDYGFVRKITKEGQVIKITGVTGTTGYLDGVAGAAKISEPGNLKSDAEGNIYIADIGNALMRKYDPKTNYISTYAGLYNFIQVGSGRDRTSGVFNDGPANKALFSFPSDLVFDSKGEMYVTDSGNNLIRKVSSVELTLPESDLDKKNWNKPTTWK